VAHPVWCDARAANFAARLDEEVFTAAIHYGEGDDGGEDAGLPARPELAGIACVSSSTPAAAPTASVTAPASPQSMLDHVFEFGQREGRTPAWAASRLHAAHRRGDNLGDLLTVDDLNADIVADHLASEKS
jgi:hypothetical protein